MWTTRRTIAGTAAFLAATAVAGCGIEPASSRGATVRSDPTVALPAAPVAAVTGAYDRTVAARTAKVAVHVVSVKGGATKTADAAGKIDFAGRSAVLTGTQDGESIEMRALGSDLYVRVPPDAGADPGKQWLKFGAGASTAAQGLDTPGTGLTIELSVLKTAIKAATRVGPAIARDTRVTRYRVVVDVAAAAAARPADRTALQMAFGDGGTTTEEVWIDGAGRIRRIVGAAVQVWSKDGGSTESETVDVYDFGTAVTVTAPPAAETEDLAAMLREAQALLASPTP